jgi:hypothetical protein
MLCWLHRLGDHRLRTTVPDPKTATDFAPGTLLAGPAGRKQYGKFLNMLEAIVKQWAVGPAETTFRPARDRLYPDQSKQELG